MSNFITNDKNRVKRRPDRGHYDKDTIYGIIDATMLCHIGFVQDGKPFVIPALHARKDDRLLIHGASTSRLLMHLQAGNQVSVNITILDGVVLAKTVFNQSVNYRSVVVFGRGRLIEDEDEKYQALEHLTEQINARGLGGSTQAQCDRDQGNLHRFHNNRNCVCQNTKRATKGRS